LNLDANTIAKFDFGAKTCSLIALEVERKEK
jgi:hypothetical protein